MCLNRDNGSIDTSVNSFRRWAKWHGSGSGGGGGVVQVVLMLVLILFGRKGT
jgi:hypothetical protein